MAIVNKPTNITKYTVQEALNRDQFQDYAAAYDDSINLTTAALVSAQTFPTSPGGVASIFADVDQNGNKLSYSCLLYTSPSPRDS